MSPSWRELAALVGTVVTIVIASMTYAYANFVSKDSFAEVVDTLHRLEHKIDCLSDSRLCR